MNSTKSDSSFTNHTHELLDELSSQALAYAEQEFGVGHPIWQSIHDQVACHCNCADACADNKKRIDGKTVRPTH
jgi:hypothetical protein